METSFQSYALALLTSGSMGSQEDVNHDDPPLEIAIRHDHGTLAVADTSSFNIPARSLLRFLIEHSPSPETIARLFIAELARCEIPTVKYLGKCAFYSMRYISCRILYASQHFEQQRSLRQSRRLGSGGEGRDTTNRRNHEASHRSCKFPLDLSHCRM